MATMIQRNSGLAARSGLIAVASLISLSTAAMAQDWSWTQGPTEGRGLYIEGAAGATWTEDFDSQSGPFPPGLTGLGFGPGFNTFRSEYNTGYAVGGRVGYGFPSGLRVEGELMYRYNDLDKVTISPGLAPGAGAGAATGSIDSVALMANALYDWRNSTRFTPYIGAGAGALWVRHDLTVPLTGPTGAASQYRVDNKSNVAPAVQAIGGVNIAVTPAISVDVDYRYLHGFDVRTENTFGFNNNQDYDNHTVFVGVRYTFAPPPPPPPPPVAPVAQPAPPPAPGPQVYLVFFDFNKYNLTPEGRDVVNQVATRASQPGAGVQQIQVNGYTDRAGTPQYNQRLSERRAETVKRALIERGVPANEIVTRAFGESNPRVPTPDGVREPQNRRVEIIF